MCSLCSFSHLHTNEFAAIACTGHLTVVMKEAWKKRHGAALKMWILGPYLGVREVLFNLETCQEACLMAAGMQ